MVTKMSEVKNLVELRIKQPKEAFPKIKQLAQSDDWKVREMAATCAWLKLVGSDHKR